jgi:hypothetical protein
MTGLVSRSIALPDGPAAGTGVAAADVFFAAFGAAPADLPFGASWSDGCALPDD